jgi:hypothetical protein
MDMEDPVYSKRGPATACIAILTTLAVLIAPFCGRICASASGCENGTAIAGSADSCHHAVVSNRSQSEGFALASGKLCNPHDLPAIVTSEQTLPSLLDTSTSTVLLFGIQYSKYLNLNLVVRVARWRDNVDPPPASLPATSTSVLRI